MGDGIWRSFSPGIARLLCAGRKMGKEEVYYVSGSTCYMADLDGWVQRNMSTGSFQLLRWVPKQVAPFQFQWQLKPDVWIDYDEDENTMLVAAMAEDNPVVKFSARGQDYEISLEAMEQKCTSAMTYT